jgi:hypothetical protein
MKHIWSVLCTRALIDKQTNLLSMIDVCDVLNISDPEIATLDPKAKEKVIIGNIRLNLATKWYRTEHNKPEKGLARTIIVAPDGERFMQPEAVVDLERSASSRAILVIDKLVFKGFGLYWLCVEQKKEGNKRWTTEAEVPLVLNYPEQETKQ